MVPSFSQEFTVRWSDIDPNWHLRGAVYFDYADHTRMAYLAHLGVSYQKLMAAQIGPIIFNTSATYKKEVRLNETVTVRCELTYFSEDYRKFGFKHFFTNSSGEEVSTVEINGAWFDIKKRKVVPAPDFLIQIMKDILVP